jgi:hypothetical protein
LVGTQKLQPPRDPLGLVVQVPFTSTAVEPNTAVTVLFGGSICPDRVTIVFAMSVEGVRETVALVVPVEVEKVEVLLGVKAGRIR